MAKSSRLQFLQNGRFKKFNAKITKNSKKIKLISIILILGALTLLLLGRIAWMVIYLVIGAIAGYYSTIMGKFVPHVTPETMTTMSILAGMVWGWKYAVLFGLLASFIAYAMNGLIKLTTILNSIVISSGGLYAGFLVGFLSLPPVYLFITALMLRTVTGIVIFWNVTPDKLEALTHAILDPIWNISIYLPIIMWIYPLLA